MNEEETALIQHSHTLVWQDRYPKEYEFQKQLQEQCVPHPHLKGKLVEKEDAETADIFKSCGLYYFTEVAQDKLCSGNMPGYRLSILRSVGLLCAAKVRERDASKLAVIDTIIADIWVSIAEVANLNATVDEQCRNKQLLIDLVTNTKDKIAVIRKDIDFALQDDQENVSMLKMQMDITDRFKSSVIAIYKNLMALIGKPPCEFNLMGLGSFARREFTAYSDFESAILLERPTQETSEEDQEIKKDCFRWVALLFDIVILNLEETLVPALNIPAFNDKLNNNDWFFDIKTPSGIAIDGLIPSSCINPLGRMEPTHKKKHLTEFIKSVDDMLKYLDHDEILLNGYHVSDVLLCSASISDGTFGNTCIYEEFEQKLCHKLMKQRSEEDKNVCEALFSQYNVLKALDKADGLLMINIKEMVYRFPTLMIMSLGRRYGVYNKSSVEIFDILHEKRIINEEKYVRFCQFLSLVSELRFRLYSDRKKHDDLLANRCSARSPVHAVVQLMGVDKVSKLFTILYEIQCSACDKDWNEAVSHESRIKIMYSLRFLTKIVDEWNGNSCTENDELNLKMKVSRLFENFSLCIENSGTVEDFESSVADILPRKEAEKVSPSDHIAFPASMPLFSAEHFSMMMNEQSRDDASRHLLMLEKAKKLVKDFENNFLNNQEVHIIQAAFNCYKIKGNVELRLGMFDEAKNTFSYLYNMIKEKYAFQCNGHSFTTNLSLLSDLVHSLICRGEEDEIVPVLENYLKDAQGTKLNRNFVFCSLHNALRECYTVSGDLSKAIGHCEAILNLPSAEVVYDDISPSYFMNLNGFPHNFDKPVTDIELNKLRYDRDRNAHKEPNWRADRIKEYRRKYAPLMGRIDWFTDDLD